MTQEARGEKLRHSGARCDLLLWVNDENRRNGTSLEGALAPLESEQRSHHLRGTITVELGGPGLEPAGGTPDLDVLQGVVRVAALPLHQGFTQAAGVGVGLTAAILAEVIFIEQRQR